MKTYPETKTTGLDWLPEIPAHWEVKKLCYVASLKSGQGITAEDIEEIGEYPVYGGNGLRGYTNKFTHTGHFALIGRQGALCGNINYASSNFYASEHAVVVSPRGEFETVWMGELLRAMNLNQYSATAAQPGLAVEAIGKLKIPIPPLPEQRAIVSYLEAKGREIESYIAAKTALLERLREWQAARIAELVIKGLDPNAPMKYSGLDWLGDIPAHWEVKPLFAVAKERDEKNIGMQVAEVLSLSYGRIILRDMENKTALLPESFETYQIVNEGNIILRLTDLQNDQRSLRVGLAKQRGIITSAYVCLEARPTIQPEYFYQLLHTYDLLKIFYSFGGGVRQSMGFDNLRRMLIPIPPLCEQAAIVSQIESDVAIVNAARERATQEISLARELWASLVAEVVTGQRDVRSD